MFKVISDHGIHPGNLDFQATKTKDMVHPVIISKEGKNKQVCKAGGQGKAILQTGIMEDQLNHVHSHRMHRENLM